MNRVYTSRSQLSDRGACGHEGDWVYRCGAVAGVDVVIVAEVDVPAFSALDFDGGDDLSGGDVAAGTVGYVGCMNRRSLLAGLLSLAGCARPAEQPPGQVVDAVPDGAILEPLFEPGTEFELTVGGRANVAVRDVGLLNLPSGKVIAVDPSWLPSWQRLGIAAYTVSVRPGRYPVSLSVMRSHGADLVAAARLSLTSSPVTAWELALRPGEDPGSLRPGEFFGVGVDVGSAGFLDAVALQYMAEQEEHNGGQLGTPGAQSSVERTDPATGANYIVFSTGYGDGHYPVWIGRDAAGAVACFVMDMLIARLPPGMRS